MSESAVAPARPPRPTSVTAAFWLQVATVVILLGLVALTLAEAVRFDGEIDRVARLVPDADPTEVADERFGNVFGALALGVPTLLLAGWLAATALPMLRGRRTARILVFVSGGAQLLICCGPACVGTLTLPLLFAPGFDEGAVDAEGEPVLPGEDPWTESRFLDILYDRQETHDAVLFPVVALSVLTVLLLTATVVLLLSLPAANRYFRSPAAPPPVGPLPYVGWSGGPYAGLPSGPHPLAGSWVPAGYPVPPGYLVCPDPALHLDRPPPAATPAEPESPQVGDPPGTTGS